jgi:hypothetical protein
VNRNSPGAAAFAELRAAGHTLAHFPSLKAAFAHKELPFDEQSVVTAPTGAWRLLEIG